ncbi:hypothetical protein [Acinetobacter terrestris]|uniref:hypothetical protein n=1 Tax=Acinetobacter terrestris TaxID=2529843 RepID=UPI00103BA93C|nr:hypothetical protein [Acinetobacter terrestris]TCB50823.1 hypothetical protein E0H84_14695 [Acinetobacter terrestris]
MLRILIINILFIICFSSAFSKDIAKGSFFDFNLYEKCLFEEVEKKECIHYNFVYGGDVEKKFGTDRVGVLYQIENSEVFLSSETDDNNDLEFFLNIYNKKNGLRKYSLGYYPELIYNKKNLILKIKNDKSYETKFINLE